MLCSFAARLGAFAEATSEKEGGEEVKGGRPAPAKWHQKTGEEGAAPFAACGGNFPGRFSHRLVQLSREIRFHVKEPTQGLSTVLVSAAFKIDFLHVNIPELSYWIVTAKRFGSSRSSSEFGRE